MEDLKNQQLQELSVEPGIENGAAVSENSGIHLDLNIEDPETVAALVAFPLGRERNRFVRTALRIGIIALNQAQSRIDADAVRKEGEHLIRTLDSKLEDYRRQAEAQMGEKLREYFDPSSGRFTERVERLVRQDGEIERVMRDQIQKAEATLTNTLAKHVGEDSPLIELLSPGEGNQFMEALRNRLHEVLTSQSEELLKEFSLDNPESALTRLARELTDRHGKLTDNLTEKIDDVVAEFSLDSDDSALSRLVSRVEQAQSRISAEFSLDGNDSALARMKRELTNVLQEHQNRTQEFQQTVLTALEAMRVRKEEAARSTTHGREFQDAGFDFIQGAVQKQGDLAEDVGNTPGILPRNKKGDALITLGPDSAASGANIVVEFKEEKGYSLKSTMAEIDEARRNREASIGLFIHSSKTAPAGMESLARYGSDIVVVWDAEDESSDVYLKAALMLAKALAVRTTLERESHAADFTAIEQSLTAIEKQVEALGEIRTWSNTIISNGGKIQKSAEKIEEALVGQTENLRVQVDHLRSDAGL